MNRSKRRLVAVGSVILGLVLLGSTLLALPAFDLYLFEHLVERRLRAGDERLFDDTSLKVLLCGTSAPSPDPDRAQSCVAVFAAGMYYLVDTGPGSGRNLALWQLRGRRLGGVFLTHFHSDHIGDLGEVSTNAWLAGHPGPLQVYDGPGVDRVLEGFNDAYAQDRSYRTANVGADLLPPAAGLMQGSVISLLGPARAAKNRVSEPFRFGELTVTTIEVNHDPAEPAYGYRFDYRGRSVVISGDTAYHPPLALAARDADVLVHEAQSRQLVQTIEAAAVATGDRRLATIMSDIQDYHTDPQDAARIANQAHVRLLVFTHLNPPVTNVLLYNTFFAKVNRVRASGWTSGKDGALVTLPVGSSEVQLSTLRP